MPGGKACSSKRSFSVNLNDSDARFDENLAFIAECIRSEGHVGKSCMNFSNTCTEIISTFETNLKSTKIPSYCKKNKLRQIYFDSKDRDYLWFLRRETEKRFNTRFRLYKTKHHDYRLVIMDKLNIIKFLHNVNLVSQHLRNKAKNVLDGYQRLTSDGEEVILSVIKKFVKIMSIQLAENVGKSQKQIIRWLNKLLSKGKIKKFRYRSFVYYNPS